MTNALRPVLFYSYNYDYLPPLAMSNGLQIENIPTLDWLKLVIEQAVKLVINNLVAALKAKGEAITDEVVQDARTEAEALFEPFKSLKAIENFPKAISDLSAALDRTTGSAQSLQSYNDLFTTIPLPPGASNLNNDAYFANLRVAGFNPLTLSLVSSLPSKFPLTQAQFASNINFAQDQLQDALDDNRLFIVDYAVLQLEPGQNPSAKNVYQPIGLFGIPKGGGTLKPIAIQGGQDPAIYPIFTSIDGENWLKMKTAFNAADGNYHELISHLGRTHLLMEPFIVATHTQFRNDHPVRVLILPSLEGTDFINAAAVDFLVNPGGSVDQLLMGTIDSDLQVSAQSVLSPGFDALMLPRFLQDRGLMDPRLVYPFRDDALLVWNAIHQWVSSYLALYYPDDEAVQKDRQIQKWAAALVAQDGGRLVGFGQQGQITSLAYLSDALTMILFTAGPQHAAVNFPQYELMSYTPSVPLAGYQPIPNEPDSGTPWLDMLPPLDMAQLQLKILYLLGTVYYTQLGQYPQGTFNDGKVEPLLHAFQASLASVEAEINTRNQTRPIPYSYLLPSKSPISINI